MTHPNMKQHVSNFYCDSFFTFNQTTITKLHAHFPQFRHIICASDIRGYDL